MKILYAVQKTGNGHLARAEALIPLFKKYAEVDVWASGTSSNLSTHYTIQKHFKGLTLFYSDSGSLDWYKIVFKNNFLQFIKDVISINLSSYDLIINDYEPITAWSCKLRKKPIIALSHQAAFKIKQTPKPKNGLGLLIGLINYYAPAKHFYGFHFKSYHIQIFTPIIRPLIRALKVETHNHYVVYLPAFSDTFLVENLTTLNTTTFKIFSRTAKESYKVGNCMVYPIDQKLFLWTLSQCTGVLCGAGFELPSEAMFLGKKLYVIPIKGQWEQECNALSAIELGARMNYNFDIHDIEDWVLIDKPIQVDFKDNALDVVLKVLNDFEKK